MDCTDFDELCDVRGIEGAQATVGDKLKTLFDISNHPRLIVSINGGLLEDTSLSKEGKEVFQKDLEKVYYS